MGITLLVVLSALLALCQAEWSVVPTPKCNQPEDCFLLFLHLRVKPLPPDVVRVGEVFEIKGPVTWTSSETNWLVSIQGVTLRNVKIENIFEKSKTSATGSLATSNYDGYINTEFKPILPDGSWKAVPSKYRGIFPERDPWGGKALYGRRILRKRWAIGTSLVKVSSRRQRVFGIPFELDLLGVHNPQTTTLANWFTPDEPAKDEAWKQLSAAMQQLIKTELVVRVSPMLLRHITSQFKGYTIASIARGKFLTETTSTIKPTITTPTTPTTTTATTPTTTTPTTPTTTTPTTTTRTTPTTITPTTTTPPTPTTTTPTTPTTTTPTTTTRTTPTTTTPTTTTPPTPTTTTPTTPTTTTPTTPTTTTPTTPTTTTPTTSTTTTPTTTTTTTPTTPTTTTPTTTTTTTPTTPTTTTPTTTTPAATINRVTSPTTVTMSPNTKITAAAISVAPPLEVATVIIDTGPLRYTDRGHDIVTITTEEAKPISVPIWSVVAIKQLLQQVLSENNPPTTPTTTTTTTLSPSTPTKVTTGSEKSAIPIEPGSGTGKGQGPKDDKFKSYSNPFFTILVNQFVGKSA
ncbi:Proteoglycan 4 [Folsomia candida]|uniref:Proteoglycan 4 n=1 Tax=Folsomia candida TaxID=158441 RepID=A0A226D7C5_FOLCA|nr:Proteoglycan 4 [Folsomia candida]